MQRLFPFLVIGLLATPSLQSQNVTQSADAKVVPVQTQSASN